MCVLGVCLVVSAATNEPSSDLLTRTPRNCSAWPQIACSPALATTTTVATALGQRQHASQAVTGGSTYCAGLVGSPRD
jgi:hypothetical protein